MCVPDIFMNECNCFKLVLALLEALSGQNMFDSVINDVNTSGTVWKKTIGEMLFLNIWREMRMR